MIGTHIAFLDGCSVAIGSEKEVRARAAGIHASARWQARAKGPSVLRVVRNDARQTLVSEESLSDDVETFCPGCNVRTIRGAVCAECVSAGCCPDCGNSTEDGRLCAGCRSNSQVREPWGAGGWLPATPNTNAQLAAKLAEAFPWLEVECETGVSGADTIDELERLYRELLNS